MALEVTFSFQRLVKKYDQELHVVTWDAVLDITEALQQEVEVWNDVAKCLDRPTMTSELTRYTSYQDVFKFPGYHSLVTF